LPSNAPVWNVGYQNDTGKCCILVEFGFSETHDLRQGIVKPEVSELSQPQRERPPTLNCVLSSQGSCAGLTSRLVLALNLPLFRAI
jgi:hypothetical protein